MGPSRRADTEAADGAGLKVCRRMVEGATRNWAASSSGVNGSSRRSFWGSVGIPSIIHLLQETQLLTESLQSGTGRERSRHHLTPSAGGVRRSRRHTSSKGALSDNEGSSQLRTRIRPQKPSHRSLVALAPRSRSGDERDGRADDDGERHKRGVHETAARPFTALRVVHQVPV